MKKLGRRKSPDGNYRFSVTLEDLVFADELRAKYGPDYNGLYYFLSLKYKKYHRLGGKYSRGRYYKSFVKGEIRKFIDRLLKEVILQDGVYSFPGKKAFIFVAEMSQANENFRYNMGTRSGKISIYYLNRPPLSRSDRYAVSRIIRLNEHWKSVLDREVKAGHKYPSFDYVLKNIKDYVYSGKFTNGS